MSAARDLHSADRFWQPSAQRCEVWGGDLHLALPIPKEIWAGQGELQTVKNIFYILYK